MLKDKVIIIVGATGGIGSVLAREFLSSEASITLFSRTESRLLDLNSQLSSPRTLVVAGDASKPEDIENVFKKTAEKFGRVDGVIIAAGTWKRLSIDEPVETALQLSDSHYQALFLPPFITGYIAQRFFRNQGEGVIVNISSHAAIRPELEGNLTYGPMKAAGHHYMKALRNELKDTKVRVTDILPAIVNTPDAINLLDTEEKKRGAVQPEDIAKWIIENFDNPDIPEEKLFDSLIIL
jgi:short-subunit dehydrogenase